MGDFDRPRNGSSPSVGDHPREGDHPKDGDTLKMCLATFYYFTGPCIMLVLSTEPIYKLTGIDRQIGGQTERRTNLRIRRHAPPKRVKFEKTGFIFFSN